MDTQGEGTPLGARKMGSPEQARSQEQRKEKAEGGQFSAVRLSNRSPEGRMSNVGLNLGEDTAPGQTREDSLLLAISSLGPGDAACTGKTEEKLAAEKRLLGLY